ncbi:helix-turn-helix domain-containing protein [Actinomadura barringtoniae]|uniref:Helix-turn-helix domain-containing protein n=1 Tax=Actinomadura barringtoniae TaxID=1427535 RepID=A0A939T7A1_9ACTN|nr:helix-turn-helix transcriptional regulator [Actinomadura barringtoniae]MBO2451794.1 helix-turn-helix domain-containing protein [Actinomadura barringtoniae]
MPEIHAAGYSPTIKKRALSRKLLAARKEIGLTTTDVCKQLRWSPSKLNYIEKAKWIEPSSDAVTDLCEVYGIEGDERDALIRLTREARQRGWWSKYNDVFDNEFPGFEAAASSVDTFQHTFLPGLLQIAGYIEVVTIAAGIEDPAEVKRHVAARLERQKILTQVDGASRLRAVIDENVIARVRQLPVGEAQLRHLLDMATRPNVELQVIRTGIGPYRGAGEAFTCLGFADPGERDIVFLETTIDNRLLEEKDELRAYRERFAQLCTIALAPGATKAYLAQQLEITG